MTRSNVKNAVVLALVMGAAIVIIFSVIMKGIRDIDMAKMTASPELKPALLDEGKVPPFDAAFLRIRPLDLVRTPVVARFDQPLGSAHGAMTYDAQPFGRMNRIKGGMHLGSDLNGIGGGNSDLGDPVRAVSDGRVVFAGDAGSGWGNMVILAHVLRGSTDVTQSVYAHLEKSRVAVGSNVKRGDQIATVGNADGLYKAHLHLEIRKGTSISPAEGYYTEPLNREKPAEFLRKQRGADDALLNSSPEVVEETVIEGLRFE